MSVKARQIVPKMVSQELWNLLKFGGAWPVSPPGGGGGGGNGGGSTGSVYFPNRRWYWVFDKGTSVPVFLTSDVLSSKHPAFSGTLSSFRAELAGLVPFGDNGSTPQVVLQVTNARFGLAWPGSPRIMIFALYCSDVSTMTYSATTHCMGIYGNTGAGFAWDIRTIPATGTTSFQQNDMMIEYTLAGSFRVIINTVIQPVTTVTSSTLTTILDDVQVVSVGNMTYDNSGTAARTTTNQYAGCLREARVWCESGSGVSVTTSLFLAQPGLPNSTKQGKPFNGYWYDAQYCHFGSGWAELFSPNMFTSYGVGVNHLFYGNNKESSVAADSSAPARIQL